jgi:hypothetical protein
MEDLPADRPSSPADALDRLTGLGPRGGLWAILAGLALSFLAVGYFAVYWRHADMDFMVVYNALLLNDGRPQQFFDHPAYLTILSVEGWFSLLHRLGALQAWTLSAIPPARDASAFDAAMTSAVRAARLVSFATALALVLAFAWLAGRLLRDRRVALLATFAFAFSGGIAVHLRILRSELLAAGFTLVALLLLIDVARRPSTLRPLWIALAAALAVLGLENKVHAVVLIAALPPLLLPFGTAGSAPLWQRPAGWLAAALALLAAAAAVGLALPLLRLGLDPAAMAGAGLKPLFGRPGVVQAALLLWLAAGMIAHGLLWRRAPAEIVAALAAAAGGAALALTALDIVPAATNAVVVLNPLEKMLSYVDPAGASATGGGPGAVLLLLADGLRLVLMRLSFVLYSSPRPTVFLTWLILPGLVVAWRRGERQVALQAAMLLGAAIAIDTLGVRRGLKSEYFILTDPLIILSGALLLDRMTDLGRLRYAYPVGVTLMALHVTISQAEPVRHALKQSGREEVCAWNAAYLPLLPLPWCPLPPPA